MNQAFNNCTSLNYVNLSNCYNLNLLAWSCFMGAGKGKDAVIYLPANANLIIGGQALSGWKNIQTAELPAEPKTMTVRFQVKAAQAISGSTLYGFLPNVVGNTEIADLTAEDVVTASDLDYAYYRTIKGTISAHFPEDTEVLSSLAEMVRNGLTKLKNENGQVIPAEDLTTENFTVYWCHVKYQSGSTDGWNINGMLIRKTTDEDPGTGVVTPDDPENPENPDDPEDPEENRKSSKIIK